MAADSYLPFHVATGQTTAGVNVPVQVTADGKLVCSIA
jgi:hypothetical protein